MSSKRLHPGTLSRERIVEVALDIAQREGAEKLSMRRIASELGTGAMSLYNHVPDKAALLEAMAERVLDEVDIPVGASWPDLARSWATSLRSTILRHRALGSMVIVANQARPLRTVSQSLVAALTDAGLDEERSRDVMRIVGRYVAGAILLDSTALNYGGAEQGPLDEIFTAGLDAVLAGLSADPGR